MVKSTTANLIQRDNRYNSHLLLNNTPKIGRLKGGGNIAGGNLNSHIRPPTHNIQGYTPSRLQMLNKAMNSKPISQHDRIKKVSPQKRK